MTFKPTWFVNHGPDASHFMWDCKVFKKLKLAKNYANDLGHNRWVIIKCLDDKYAYGPRSVTSAGNENYKKAALKFCEKVNNS